jgi:DNA modification methylase
VVADATIKGSETGTSFRQALYFKECGFNLHDTMIYEKLNYMPGECMRSKRYRPAFEYMFVLSKNGVGPFNLITIPKTTNTNPGHFRKKDGSLKPASSPASIGDTKAAPNVWQYTVGGQSHGHPATFPEQLAADHIVSWSNPGDLVLDPFSGSGTTGKMAILNGRHFIGIDISPEYVEIARKRITEVIAPEPDYLANMDLPVIQQESASGLTIQ